MLLHGLSDAGKLPASTCSSQAADHSSTHARANVSDKPLEAVVVGQLTRAQALVSALELFARSIVLSLGVDALVEVDVVLLKSEKRKAASVGCI